MKRYICILIAYLCCLAAFTQGYQHRMASAINAGTYPDFFIYTDAKNTGDYTDDFKHLYYYYEIDEFVENDYATPARDIFHKFTITKSMDIYLNYEESLDSFPHGISYCILDVNGNPVFAEEYGIYSGNYPAPCPLMPGTYYVVSQAVTYPGNENDIGVIDMSIEGTARVEGEDFFYPFMLGTFNSDFTTSHTIAYPEIDKYMCDYRMYPSEDISYPRRDMVHQFTITQPMRITIDTRGSRLFHSMMPHSLKLLTEAMDTVSGSGYYRLEEGTYYLYSRFAMAGWPEAQYVLNIDGSTYPPGSTFSNPIEIGNKAETFTYTHTENTSSFFTSQFHHKPGNEVFYKLILTVPMEITANNCGSPIADTYLQVFTENQQLLYSNDNYTGTGACPNTQSAYIKIPALSPGTYFFVSDGASNGNITTAIQGTAIGPEGDLMLTAIDAGTHEVGFHFSDTQNTALEFSNQFAARPTNDVFYKFTLVQPVDITISHCGSAVIDTYMSVLNEGGTVIYSNDNYTGEGRCSSTGNAVIKIPQMAPGTYYVVSEGNSQNGSITTTIEGIGGFGNLNTTKGQPNMISVTPLVEASELTTLPVNELQLEVQYFDHFGNPVENILPNFAPLGGDLVTLQETDGFSRESRRWLPVVKTTNGGGYMDPHQIKAAARDPGGYNDQRPYSELVYDNSPQDIIATRYGPGNDWYLNTRSIRTDMMTNYGTSGELSCARYVTGGTPAAPTFSKTGFYANSELIVIRQTDEDNNYGYEFRDKAGRTLLTRRMNGTVPHDTYYIHDHYGNLCFVLPPAAADALTQNNVTWSIATPAMKDYGYIYKFDEYNRCIQKKLPGCDPVEMRYDKADRLIFSRDGNQRLKNEWTFFLHDVFGRSVVTGIWVSATIPNLDNTVVKADFNLGADGAKLGGYKPTGLTLPATVRLLSVNYYDDYSFLNLQMSAKKDSLSFSDEGYLDRHTGARGLATGNRTYHLDDPSRYSVAATYYDHLGRVVQSRASNHMGGYDKEYFDYTFSGKVLKRKLVHSAPPQSTRTEVHTYSYDHAERLLSVSHKLDNAPTVTMAEYAYDQTGRLKTRQLHETLDTTTYDYNIRDWVTRISGSKFSQTLTYNTAVNGVIPSKALFNGNISAMKWKAGDETTERGYKFTYDGLDRLTNATYGEGAAITNNPDRFNETLSYDKTGNILALQRRGKLDSGYGVMDDLAYTYTGNRLTKVTDAATPSITYPGAFHFVDRANVANECTYDANGNLTKDLNKNITSITYNVLNLPDRITFGDGNRITYGYDASGSKLSVTYQSGTNVVKTGYVGNKVYRNGTLGMILMEEGYITFSGTTPVYHYYLKDHQGNNRVVINQAGTVLQVNHYYPFGGVFGEGVQDSNQPYRYNGKELDRLFGLDMYDFHWRQYMADLGRTTTPDPHAENYYGLSPYSMFANNPIRYIDPDGRDIWEINDEGRIINRIKDKTQDAFYMVSKDADGNYQRTYTTDAEGNKTYNSISFEYGTVESQRSISFSPDGRTTDTYDVYKVRGDDRGTQLFEFMSNNVTGSGTAVEVSQAMTGISGDKGLNFITTGHMRATEPGMTHLLNGQLLHEYTIRELNHSHPYTTNPSNSDIGFSTAVSNIMRQRNIPIPAFNIYYVPGKQKIPFGR